MVSGLRWLARLVRVIRDLDRADLDRADFFDFFDFFDFERGGDLARDFRAAEVRDRLLLLDRDGMYSGFAFL